MSRPLQLVLVSDWAVKVSRTRKRLHPKLKVLASAVVSSMDVTPPLPMTSLRARRVICSGVPMDTLGTVVVTLNLQVAEEVQLVDLVHPKDRFLKTRVGLKDILFTEAQSLVEARETLRVIPFTESRSLRVTPRATLIPTASDPSRNQKAVMPIAAKALRMDTTIHVVSAIADIKLLLVLPNAHTFLCLSCHC